jgi:hypothetical protein
MSKKGFKPPGPGANPHDYISRKTIGDPLIAADLLENYADPVVAKHIDLTNLRPEVTDFFGPVHPNLGLQEVKLDIPYIARFRDEAWNSEALLVYEHKSSPNIFVVLQLAVYVVLSLYKRWKDAGRPSSLEKLKLPVPLMILVYCGEEDLDEEMLCFQRLFGNLSEELKQFVLQFRLIIINFRKFDYANLTGRPETRAFVETSKRAFDGTLAEHFCGIMDRFETTPIDDRIMDLIGGFTWYSGRVADVDQEEMNQAITKLIKGKDGIDMVEMIKKGIFQEGKAEGKAEGKLQEKVDNILSVLQVRLGEVPESIVNELHRRTDLIALQSLLMIAAQCNSIAEFQDAL